MKSDVRGGTTEVLAGDTRWLAGLALNEEMIASVALGSRRVVRGSLAGAEQVVAARHIKAALHLETGAAAVDMESHIAAAYAAGSDLPFAAASSPTPPAGRCGAGGVLKPNGDVDLGKLLRGVARNPTTLRALVSTGLDFNRALRSLRGCRGFLLGGEPRPGGSLMWALLHFGREDVLRRPLVIEADLGGHRPCGLDPARHHPHRLQQLFSAAVAAVGS